MARSRLLIRIVVVLAVVLVLGVLFVRSVLDTRAEPYTVERERLQNWIVALEPAPNPIGAMLSLRPPPELASDLFRQIFRRAMESLNAPAVPAVPLVLQTEFDRAFAGHLAPDVILAAAREAGLGSVPFEPRCMAYRRVSEPRVTRQLYFVVFDAPAFGQFREQLASLVPAAGATGVFDPAALSPVLVIAASDPAFGQWLPLRAEPDSDCIAPIAIHPG